jgi:hypothetical protein
MHWPAASRTDAPVAYSSQALCGMPKKKGTQPHAQLQLHMMEQQQVLLCACILFFGT